MTETNIDYKIKNDESWRLTFVEEQMAIGQSLNLESTAYKIHLNLLF